MNSVELVKLAIDLMDEGKEIEYVESLVKEGKLSKQEAKIVKQEMKSLQSEGDRPATDDEMKAVAMLLLELEQSGYDLDDREEMSFLLENCDMTWDQYSRLRKLAEVLA